MNKDTYYDEFIKKGLIPLDKYVRADIQIKTRCSICNKEFMVTPRSIGVKTGYGCRTCNAKNSRYSTNDFVSVMNKVNSNIEIIGDYIDSKTKIKCRCKIDDYEFMQRPNDLQQGIGCPMCSGYIHHTNEEFQKLFRDNCTKPIKIKSKFSTYRNNICCECEICGFEWNAKPYDIIKNKTGCKVCSGIYSPTTEEFKDKIRQINNNIIVIGNYINVKTPIKCKCGICGNIFNPTPTNLIYGKTGCPECNNNKSIMETSLKKFFDKNNIIYIPQYKFEDLKGLGNKPLSYDFYLPQFNKLIECQGKQHFESIDYFGGKEQFKIQQEHDKRKREYAKINNIDLIEISYKDKHKIVERIIQALNLNWLSA